jgi:hypothetical protein
LRISGFIGYDNKRRQNQTQASDREFLHALPRHTIMAAELLRYIIGNRWGQAA